MLDISDLKLNFDNDLSNVTCVDDFKALQVSYLGNKSEIKRMFSKLIDIKDVEEKRRVADSINNLKTYFDQSINAKKKLIEDNEIGAVIKEESLDMTLSGVIKRRGSRHPLSEIEIECLDILRLLGFEYVEGPEIETSFYNFDALNIPEYHPARDLQDTFWLENELLLRSHTTTVQARILEERKGNLPVKIVSPGKVYRNEKVDATHLACFHQFEGLYVDKGVRFSDLKGTIEFFVKEIFGANWNIRFKPKFYPYTEPSIGVDISDGSKNSEWITIGGAGMVHPQVFRNLGYDPESVSGFAFGMGISRMVTIRHGLNHIKSLYENDLRVHRNVARKKHLQ